jgi:hypothetical protein
MCVTRNLGVDSGMQTVNTLSKTDTSKATWNNTFKLSGGLVQETMFQSSIELSLPILKFKQQQKSGN